MEGIIISLAALVFLAHLFSALFVKTRMPEVLPLMVLGIIVGPVLNLVTQSDFGMVDQVFTRVLLIVILFESGLGIKISQIKTTFAQTSKITLVSFITVVATVTLAAKLILGLNWIYAVILGSILADNSFAIIIPLISKLNISQRIKTVLMMESTLNGVIAIIVTITLIDMAKINSFAPSMIAAKIIYTFLISVAVGSAAAVFWTTVLNKIRKLQNSIFLTIAFVMVVYSVCESLGSDGSIGAFVFGIVAGNIRIIKKLGWLNFLERYTISVKGKSFNEVEKSFFSEVVFVLSTFFFVYIGISIRITSFSSMLYGLFFTLIIFLARIPAVNYSLDKNISKMDCTVAAAMTPKGLVTAVLASLVAQSGIAGGALLQDIIYSVIMFSIIFATGLAFLAEKGYAVKMADLFFKRHNNTTEDSLQKLPAEVK